MRDQRQSDVLLLRAGYHIPAWTEPVCPYGMCRPWPVKSEEGDIRRGRGVRRVWAGWQLLCFSAWGAELTLSPPRSIFVLSISGAHACSSRRRLTWKHPLHTHTHIVTHTLFRSSCYLNAVLWPVISSASLTGFREDKFRLPCSGFGLIMYTSVNAIYIIPCWGSLRERKGNACCYSSVVLLMDYLWILASLSVRSKEGLHLLFLDGWWLIQ